MQLLSMVCMAPGGLEFSLEQHHARDLEMVGEGMYRPVLPLQVLVSQVCQVSPFRWGEIRLSGS